MIDEVKIVQSSARWYGTGLFYDAQAHASKCLDCNTVSVFISNFCYYQEVEAMIIEEIWNIVSFVIDRTDVQ